MAERCAVIGVGQTVCKSKREDVSIAGLVREAALAALEDAGLGFGDVDAVVVGATVVVVVAVHVLPVLV